MLRPRPGDSLWGWLCAGWCVTRGRTPQGGRVPPFCVPFNARKTQRASDFSAAPPAFSSHLLSLLPFPSPSPIPLSPSPQGPIGAWGHEYVRNLAGEVGAEWAARRATAEEGADGAAGAPAPTADLLELVSQILPYHMGSASEPEAVDLLLEVDRLDLLPDVVDAKNVGRTCLYLSACAPYLPEPDDAGALRAAHACYAKTGRDFDALRIALQLGDVDLAAATFAACADPATQVQLAYLLGRQGVALDFEEGPAAIADPAQREACTAAASNSRAPDRYAALARDLDVLEPRAPDDVYKLHLADGRPPAGAAAADSARANLAATFVNAFVNAGFGTDRLMVPPGGGAGAGADGGDAAAASGDAAAADPGSAWVFKNKEAGKTAAAASLGLVTLWDVEGGLPLIDKYLYAADEAVVAGALLGVGIACCGVRHENDPAYALLYDFVDRPEPGVKGGAIMGLGLAYAGSAKEEVADLLAPLAADPDLPIGLAGQAALALGLVFAGRAHAGCVEAILQALMSRPAPELAEPGAKMMALALGLLFLRRQGGAGATLEVCRTLDPRISAYALATLEGCAYAGTGDVLRVQSLLGVCGEHPAPPPPPAAEGEGVAAAAAPPGGAAPAADGAAPPADAAAAPAAAPAAAAPAPAEDEPWRTAHQGAAVLGVALVALGEDLGGAMAGRALDHVLQYGEPASRRGVPLALALLHASNPDARAVDTLGRLAHDTDADVARAAVLGLGIVGAGTNHARLAGMLRGLASYHNKEPSLLFLVRVAQGLVHAGKGLLTLSPRHTDGALLSTPALGGLLALLHAGLDARATVAGRTPQALFFLAPALRPRMLMTVDEAGEPLAVPVRVGQAVDVVAQAGRPKAITGFQTHTTPVLLSAGERAELATTKFLALAPVLEGVVILKPNPDYVEAAHE